MENADLDKLCRQIYVNHRQALDLIWAQVGSPSSELVGRIQKWIEERPDEWLHVSTSKSHVRFIPAVWNKMLPPAGRKVPARALDQNEASGFQWAPTTLCCCRPDEMQ